MSWGNKRKKEKKKKAYLHRAVQRKLFGADTEASRAKARVERPVGRGCRSSGHCRHAHREIIFASQLLINVEIEAFATGASHGVCYRRNAHVAHGREPSTRDLQKRLEGERRQCRDEREQCGRFLSLPVELASLLVLAVMRARRIGRVLGDAGHLVELRVGVDNMHAYVQNK